MGGVGRGSSLGLALGLRAPGRRMVPEARDGGKRARSRFVLSPGNIRVSWNDGAGHQKQHLNWRWDVGGASKWALQPVCAEPPALSVEESGPRVRAGGTSLEGWQKEVELA